ncbi:MAG: type II toxin-antitoxin system HicA family toxin [Gammaproteobacteria bacterium]|nr:type II toxin-antitoxin system HicA family toxin [Gammaproteobacteria bacterium]
MAKPCTYRKLIKILKKHDSRFVIEEKRGKGSERMILHPDIDGREAAYPVKCHGEGTELRTGTVDAILRRFNLPKNLV